MRIILDRHQGLFVTCLVSYIGGLAAGKYSSEQVIATYVDAWEQMDMHIEISLGEVTSGGVRITPQGADALGEALAQHSRME